MAIKRNRPPRARAHTPMVMHQGTPLSGREEVAVQSGGAES